MKNPHKPIKETDNQKMFSEKHNGGKLTIILLIVGAVDCSSFLVSLNYLGLTLAK